MITIMFLQTFNAETARGDRASLADAAGSSGACHPDRHRVCPAGENERRFGRADAVTPEGRPHPHHVGRDRSEYEVVLMQGRRVHAQQRKAVAASQVDDSVGTNL